MAAIPDHAEAHTCLDFGQSEWAMFFLGHGFGTFGSFEIYKKC